MKKYTKIITLFSLILFMSTVFFTTQASAQAIRLEVHGQEFNQGEILSKEGRTYIPIRSVAELLGAEVKWNGDAQEVSIIQNQITVKFIIGEHMIYRNDISLLVDAPAFINNSTTYVPVRFASEALNYEVGWDPINYVVSIEKKPVYVVNEGDTLAIISSKLGITIEQLQEWNQLETEELLVGQELFIEQVQLTTVDEVKAKAVINYQKEELEWLARIIYSEAQDEPFDGLVAVGAVVIHRVLDPSFPNTIKEVIFQPGQFTPVKTGKIYSVEPDKLSYQAAEEALMGNDPVIGALFFYNPKVSTSPFFVNREVIADIGNHRFVQ